MAAGLSTAAILKPYNLVQPPIPLSKPTTSLFFNPLRCFHHSTILRVRPRRRMSGFTVCVLTEDSKEIKTVEQEQEQVIPQAVSAGVAEKLARKKSQRFTYLVAAVMSSFGITSMAVFAVYYRFSWQMEGGDVPWSEMLGTFSLSVGAASHHRPREGPFELNDVFAIINAVPAIALLSYGIFHKGLVPGLCFGAGLGITVFGMAYMFVHDGLVHKRFPVGPIANVPYFRRVAAAHQVLSIDLFKETTIEPKPRVSLLGAKEKKNLNRSLEPQELTQKMRDPPARMSPMTRLLDNDSWEGCTGIRV
ncbi:hypothetical protein JHK85_029642 [Glycine max]|nr:hypothetical protein JHK85_029642 [Glycine max]